MPNKIEISKEDLEKLEQHFEKCEFDDGDCDFCDTENKRIWFESTSYEYPDEGNYYCDKCGLKKIKTDEECCKQYEAEEKAIDKPKVKNV